MWNGSSNFTGAAYISFAPDFFWDYFIENNFKDVRVHLAELRRQAQNNKYMIYKYLGATKFVDRTDTFFSPYLQMTIVMATKSEETTVGMIPIQSFYRPADRDESFNLKKDRMLESMSVPDVNTKKMSRVFYIWSFIIVSLYTLNTDALIKYLNGLD